MAIRDSDVETVRRLIAAAVDVNERDSFGDPPLIAALGPGVALEPLAAGGAARRRVAIDEERLAQKQMVDLLLNAGADVNARGAGGTTPLMTFVQWTSSPEDTAMLTTLLAHHAAIDAQDDAGETALMVAARRGHRQVTEALVRAGARKDLRNCNGQTAADLSERHPAIAEILRR